MYIRHILKKYSGNTLKTFRDNEKEGIPPIVVVVAGSRNPN
jgi:hypothetical protein